MNGHPPHSPADMRPVFFIALALGLLLWFALALALVLAGGAPSGPLHAPPGLAL